VSGAWWRGGVVYQVYLRSFADSDGDGVGDLRGLLGKVDYLAALGVDAVWVSPFYVSPQEDNGYDIADYDRIDQLFGTDEDLAALVDALHARDIRLVIDLAVNHTSREHPWFQDARQPGSRRRDWYWWQARPTNWASYFSGSAWEWDDVAGANYLHVFGTSQPDLNWENPAVRAEVAALMRRWLDRGVDGFRLDVINFISKVTDASGKLSDAAASPSAPLADGRSEFVNGPRLEEYLHELDREVLSHTTRHGEPVLSIGEMPDITPALARRITDAATGSMDIVFSFDHVDLDHEPGDKWSPVPVTAADVVRCLASWQDALADSGWNSLYWSNHDQPRVVSRWGDDMEHRAASAKTLGTVLHLMRGTPFVYQGEELGLPGAGLRDLDVIHDIESRNHYTAALAAGADPDEVLDRISRIGRDNARTPMPWDDGPHGGFTIGEPWLPAATTHCGLDAQAQRDDPGSVWHHYRRLIDLRHKFAVVVEGSFTPLETGHPDLVAYRRDHDGEVLVVVAHLAEGSVPLPSALAALVAPGEVLLATTMSDNAGTLGSWESRVHLVR